MYKQRAIEEARSWIGTPYCHQASAKGAGCDCLGLIRGVWRTLYGIEPESQPVYTADWGEGTEGEPLLEAARRHLVETIAAEPGTVLIFRWRPWLPAKHAGIQTTAEKFIHAYDRSGVVETTLGPQWRRRVASVFNFPDSPRGTI